MQKKIFYYLIFILFYILFFIFYNSNKLPISINIVRKNNYHYFNMMVEIIGFFKYCIYFYLFK